MSARIGSNLMAVYYEAKDIQVAAGQLSEESTVADLCVLRSNVQRFSQNLTQTIKRIKRAELRRLEKEKKK